MTKLSTEELKRNEKDKRIIFFMFIGIYVSLVGTVIYSTIKNGITSIIAVPFALLPLLFISYKNFKEIKKEIESRGHR